MGFDVTSYVRKRNERDEDQRAPERKSGGFDVTSYVANKKQEQTRTTLQNIGRNLGEANQRVSAQRTGSTAVMAGNETVYLPYSAGRAGFSDVKDAYRQEAQNRADYSSEEYQGYLKQIEDALSEQQRRNSIDPTEAAYQLDQLRQQSAALDAQLQPLDAVQAGSKPYGNELWDARQREKDRVDAAIKQLEDDLASVEKNRQLLNYGRYVQAEDFEQGSQYNPNQYDESKTQTIAIAPGEGELGGGAYTLGNGGDELYEYVNGNPDVIEKRQESMRALGADPNTADAFMVAGQMSDEEKAIFNYIFNTQGADKAHEYFDLLTPDLNYRYNVAQKERYAQLAQESPGFASVYSTLVSPDKIITLGTQIQEMLENGETDQNAPYNRYSNIPTTIRGEVSKMVEDKYGKVGSFAYQTGMSILDNVYQMAITGGSSGEAFMLTIMGTGAAADGVIAAKERGLTDDQAFALGLVSGAVEAITEKIGLDELYGGIKAGRPALTAMLRSTLAEGSEEIASTVLDDIADMIIAGVDSERIRLINQLTSQGYTHEQAVGMAFADLAKEAGVSGLAGALSGLFMSGGAQALMASYNSIAQSAQNARDARESQQLAEELLSYMYENNPNLMTGSEYAAMPSEAPSAVEGTQIAQPEAVDTIPTENATQPVLEPETQPATIPVTAATTPTTETNVQQNAQTPTEVSGQDAAHLTMLGNTLWQNGRKALETHYDPSIATVNEYAKEFMQVYNAELNGKETPRTITLSDAQIYVAKSAAQNDARANSQATVSEPQSKATAAANVGFHDSTGTVSKQTASVLDALAKLTKTSIEIDPNVDDEINGKIVGNRITLQKASDLELIKTAKHEITHRLQELAPEAYKAYRDYAIYALSGNGDIDALVQKYQADYKTVGQNLSSDEAMDEIAADFTEALVVEAEKGSTETFAKLAKHDERAARGIVQAIRDFIARLKEAFTGRQADTISRQTFGVSVAELERAAQLWDNLLEEGTRAAENLETDTNENAASENDGASDNVQSVSGVKYDTPAPAYNGTDTAVIETDDGKRLSLKSAREDLANFNWDTFKQGKMYKDLRTIDLGDEDIHALFDGIRGLVEYMTPNRGILDMNEETDKADRKYKPYKPNSDPLYKVSLDFSTLCRKRLMTQFVIEQLQLRENRSLTAEEQLTVRNMLIDYRAQDKALQVACAMCYVEAARLKSPKFINAYLDNPVPVIVDYMAKKSKSFDAQIRKRQADFKEAHGYARDTAKKNMSAADVNELNKLTPQWRQEYKPSEEEQKIIDYAKTLPNSTYLTAENLANLASGTPAEQTIYGAYTNYIREMTHSKGLETGVAYYYGDSRKVSAKRLAGFNAENGLRFDSWSDFQFEHMLDMMTAVIDLSTRKVGNTRGAKMHGYTKFPEMVRIFGKTGMMFNLSGVPEGNGFNEDGSLRFSGTESIDYDEAIKVRDQFPETAGMQCIGISDEHILALLESEVIDYIIPYHRSGMNAMLRKMAGIDNWTDYEGTQEAAVDKSIAFDSTKHDSKTWHKEPVFSEFFVGYDTGMSGIEAMRASAENYKRMCEERGLKPKFEKFTDNENYWKLLIDRKMINQKTGALIEQKAVRPIFDFDAIKTEIDRYVANYDPELQDRALEYITEHWQAEPTEQAAVLGNEAYAAQQRGVEGTPGARLSIKHGSGLEALQRENQRLRETVEELKAQTKPTTRRNVTVSNSDVRAAARNILKANESTLKAEDISAELKAIFEYVARDGEYVTERGEDGRARTRREAMSYEGLMDKVRPLAAKITNSSRIMNSPEFQTWKAIDTFLYGKKIAMSALEQSRLPGGTAAAFNAANGRVKISTVGVPVAEAYKALRTMAGEDFFPADITTPEEQAVRISQVYAGLAPIAESPYSEGLARANSVVADQIASEALDAPNMISPITEALRQARAERDTTLQAERERFGEEMRATRADRDAALRQQHNELMTSKAEALRAVREDRDAKIQALKEHFREQNTLRRNAREMSAARQKLLKVARRLQRIKTQAQYKAALNEIIGDIDTVAVGITGKHHADLVALRDEYAQMMKGLPDHLRNLALEEKLSRLEKRRIADMDIEEVRELTDILLGIENFLRNVGKPVANVNGTELSTFDSRDIYTQGLQVISDVQRSQGSKKTLWDWVVTNELTPERFANRITGYAEGDPLVNAVKGLSTGQRVMLDYQRRAYEQFKKFTADTKFMEEIRGKKAKTITITGMVDGKATQLQITPDMRMALALHLLNRDNMKHIEGGGIIIPALDYLNKGDLAEAYARPQATISLSHDAVAEIVKGMTAKEIDYVNAAHAFLNSQSKTDINAVSEALMGWPVANVDNYFPINVSRDFTHSDYESLKRDGTIEGMGILKERVQSSLPIYLRGMTDVLNEAVRMQSKFVGLAIPVHNLSQLLNVTQLARPDATDVSYNTSVQSAIKEKWGARAGTYIERMLDDVQFSAPSTEELDSILGKIRSNYAGAVLSLNLSVAMKQAASYPTAAAELGWGPLLKALKSTGRVDLDLINKYTPVQWRRSNGFGTPELGDIRSRPDTLVNRILNTSFTTKSGYEVAPFNWIQTIDLLTTRKLWKASEFYVTENQPSLRHGTDEYYKAVAEVYNRVIEQTQPNYDVMQRPQLLRSKSSLVRTLAMFKTQPFQNFNILYDAIGAERVAKQAWEATGNEEAKAKYEEAKTRTKRAVGSSIVSAVVFATMTMLWNVLRRKRKYFEDKKGDVTVGSVVGKLATELAKNYAGQLIFGSEIYDAAEALFSGNQYNGIDSVSTSAISDAAGAVISFVRFLEQNVSDLAEGKRIDWDRTRVKLGDFASDMSKLFGIPMDNVQNLINATVRNTADIAVGRYMGEYTALRMTTPLSNTKAYYDLLYRAYRKSPNDFYELYYTLVGDGFSEDGIKSAMENRMKKDQGVSSVNDLRRRFEAP